MVFPHIGLVFNPKREKHLGSNASSSGHLNRPQLNELLIDYCT